MPRTGYTTQTRTFNYNVSGTIVTAFLQSATNPENGTVSYTYSNGLIASKTDAAGQKTTYSYDSYNRLTQVSHFVPAGTEDKSQRVNYYYDTNPFDTNNSFSFYTAGRVAAVTYGPENNSTTNQLGYYLPTFAEWYNYLPSGLGATKRLQVQQTSYWTNQHGVGQTNPQVMNFDAAYTYDTGGEGKILSVSYPSTTAGAGPKYTYSFDSMYRLAGMTDQNSNTDVSGVAYNAANQLTAITYFGRNEQRNYNTLNQLTNIAAYTTPGNWIINKGYTYPSGTNIGKISSQTDGISGEVVQFTYDSLNRLLSASATSPTAWGQTFSYDPFGNLTAKTATGAAPTIPTSAEPSGYDANGNVTATYGSQYIYDGQNRMVEYIDTINNGATLAHFGYDAQNRRVWQWNGSLYAPYNVNPAAYTVYFYGVNGKRLASYQLTANVTWQGNQVSSVYMASAVAQQDTYFGRRRLATMDRLASTSAPSESFYPYGEDKGTPKQTTAGSLRPTGVIRLQAWIMP